MYSHGNPSRLKVDLDHWLEENKFYRVHDMTEMVWSPKKVYMVRHGSKDEPTPQMLTSLKYTYYHYFFREADHALLFKLAWGGS
jgi:hypothetical protein